MEVVRQAGHPKEKRCRSHLEKNIQKECLRCRQKGHAMSTYNYPLVYFAGSTTNKHKRVIHCTCCKVTGHTECSCKEAKVVNDRTSDRSSHIPSNIQASRE